MPDELSKPESQLTGPIMLVGASVRQLAQLLAPLQVACEGFDLFGDWDTSQMIPVRKIRRYSDVLNFSTSQKWGGFIMAGGLELQPSLIEELEGHAKIFGCHPDSVRMTNDPIQLQQVFAQNSSETSARFPQVCQTIDANDSLDRWLLKSKCSTGGKGVGNARSRSATKDHYFQRKVGGTQFSAILISNSVSTKLLGCSRQLIGNAGNGAKPYCYSGTVGPATLTAFEQRAVLSAGEKLAAGLGLRGIFGIDFSIENETVWVYDVNPRITSSAEILQRTLFRGSPDFIGQCHLDVFLSSQLPETLGLINGASIYAGKMILFNRSSSPIVVSKSTHDQWVENSQSDLLEQFWFTDIPNPDEQISSGHPVLTVQANSSDMNRINGLLIKGTKRVYGALESNNYK